MSACQSCKKSPPEVSLKKCAKCSTTPYCSRDCQKADWKAHKKTCGKQSSGPDTSGPSSAPPHDSSDNNALDSPTTKPFTRLSNGTWMHDRPEKDVYRLLIDAYRLRAQDMYNLDDDIAEDSIYSEESDSVGGFKKFLATVERHKNGALLPAWWNAEKKAECVAFGASDEGWWSLSGAVEKSDVNERYGDPQFAMQLRMFAEAVYGRGPGGSDGTGMRTMLASLEGAGMQGVQVLV